MVAPAAVPAQASGPLKVTARTVAPGTTVVEAPQVSEARAASFAVTVWVPAVRSWIPNARAPASVAVYIAGAGSCAAASVALIAIVPVYPVARLPNASRTATRNPTWAPAAAAPGRSIRLHAAPAPAETVNVADPFARPSVTKSDWDEASRNVTLNVCWPASAEVNVKLAGSVAVASLEEKLTVPA